jgi:hypothetical protein
MKDTVYTKLMSSEDPEPSDDTLHRNISMHQFFNSVGEHKNKILSLEESYIQMKLLESKRYKQRCEVLASLKPTDILVS